MPSAERPPWKSLLAASAGYLTWGLVPIYWKQFQGIDATELIAHRMVWALVFLVVVVGVQGGLRELRATVTTRVGFTANLLSGSLLTVNWLVYVWAVNSGHVIECSLGYFLVPLLNVALGRWLLGEQLRPAQICAIALAACGVALLIWQVGKPPWIALALAGSFGFYGLLRKRSPLGALMGLTAETLLLAPLAAALLIWRWRHGLGALGHVDTRMTALLFSTGVVTAIPLVLFAYGARGLRFTTLGLLQYLAPTCQFLLGWLTYGEPLSRERAVSFSLIWLGLFVYSADAIWKQRRPPSTVAAPVLVPE